MHNDNILRGYTSQKTAYEVKDYPYGFRLRTSIFYWIETKKGKGDRFCSYTINPKTGRPNKPKCGTYSPFLYMYLTEDEGHVKVGGIDSYDREVFEARFGFIIEKIGEQFLSDDQKLNLRVDHYRHVIGNAPYEIVKYSDDKKDEFKTWVNGRLKHIKTCDFKDLVNYPEAPPIDNQDGEVTMTIIERESQ